MKIKAIVFDLDDTLYDARDYFDSAFEFIAEWLHKEYNIDKNTAIADMKKVLSEKGGSYKKIFNDSFSSLGITDPNAVGKAVELFHNAPLDGLKPYDDAAVLEKLCEKYDVGILTLGSRKKQERKITLFGFNKVAKFIIYAQDVGYVKPDPRLYNEILKKSNYKASEILVVGDNPFMDFPGAKIAGMKTCRLLRGEFADMPDDGCRPDMSVKSLFELEKNLEKVNE